MTIREFLRAMFKNQDHVEKVMATAESNASRFDEERTRQLEEVEERLRRIQADHLSLIKRQQTREGS